ncbi:hypothetical protein QBC39DRAFT_111711 [Podospora conica]|nr:hypothetical protein QBC39DRAFT_111711 [Schizothecium conicum]
MLFASQTRLPQPMDHDSGETVTRSKAATRDGGRNPRSLAYVLRRDVRRRLVSWSTTGYMFSYTWLRHGKNGFPSLVIWGCRSWDKWRTIQADQERRVPPRLLTHGMVFVSAGCKGAAFWGLEGPERISGATIGAVWKPITKMPRRHSCGCVRVWNKVLVVEPWWANTGRDRYRRAMQMRSTRGRRVPLSAWFFPGKRDAWNPKSSRRSGYDWGGGCLAVCAGQTFAKTETKRAVYDDLANMGLGAGEGDPNERAARCRRSAVDGMTMPLAGLLLSNRSRAGYLVKRRCSGIKRPKREKMQGVEEGGPHLGGVNTTCTYRHHGAWGRARQGTSLPCRRCSPSRQIHR